MSSLLNDPVVNFLAKKRKSSFLIVSTLILTVILTSISLIGLFIPANIYPTQVLIEFFKTNDLVNLIIGLPILLGSLWLTRRGHLIGLLFWPGSMMYVIYNYIAYMVAMPINILYILYAVLVIGGAYIFFNLISQINNDLIQEHLAGKVHEKLAGGLLVGFGAAFSIRAVSMLSDGTTMERTDLSVLIADIVLSLTWIISGVLLWQRKSWGYVTGGALLFQGATLFLGLILFLIINPLMTQVAFDLEAVIVVFVMSVFCNIPFVLFVRGVVRSR